jgi:hypothetical protein
LPPHALHAPPAQAMPLPQFWPSPMHAPFWQQPLPPPQAWFAVAQQVCDGPPQARHCPVWQRVRPALQSLPLATQVLPAPQQAAPMQLPLAQQAPPTVPQGWHVPFAQPSVPPHWFPAQHA